MELDHLVVRRQGRGTFVSDPSADEIAGRFIRLHGVGGARIRGQIRETDVVRGVANELERARLKLSDHDEVYRVRRVHYHNGAPFLVEDARLPAELFPGLDQRRRVSDHIGILAKEYRILLGNAEERLSTTVPPPAVAAALRMPPHAPVVMLDRIVAALDNGRLVEWRLAHSHLPGSYYLAELS
jgi:GntR family transcriptional regulator